jgi:hypothetical protein
MQETHLLQSRIERTFRSDRLLAWGFIVALWAAVGAVYLAVRPLIQDPAIGWWLLGSAILVVGYNTASLIAMVSHYAEDKQWIYEIDIRRRSS